MWELTKVGMFLSSPSACGRAELLRSPANMETIFLWYFGVTQCYLGRPSVTITCCYLVLLVIDELFDKVFVKFFLMIIMMNFLTNILMNNMTNFFDEFYDEFFWWIFLTNFFRHFFSRSFFDISFRRVFWPIIFYALRALGSEYLRSCLWKTA